VSKILFSGDLGVSMLSGQDARRPITNLMPMPAWHGGVPPPLHGQQQNPQAVGTHGSWAGDFDDRSAAWRPLQGTAITQLLDWLDNLSCGIDLMGTPQYQLPVTSL